MIEKLTLNVTDRATGINKPIEFDIPTKSISNLNHYVNSIIYVVNRVDTMRKCPHCGRHVLLSDMRDYSFQCLFCDEDFFSFECPETTEPVTKEKLDEAVWQTYNYFSEDLVKNGIRY